MDTDAGIRGEGNHRGQAEGSFTSNKRLRQASLTHDI